MCVCIYVCMYVCILTPTHSTLLSFTITFVYNHLFYPPNLVSVNFCQLCSLSNLFSSLCTPVLAMISFLKILIRHFFS